MEVRQEAFVTALELLLPAALIIKQWIFCVQYLTPVISIMVARFTIVVVADEIGLVIEITVVVTRTRVDIVVYGILQAGGESPYVLAGESMCDADSVGIERVDVIPDRGTKGIGRSHLVRYHTPTYF